MQYTHVTEGAPVGDIVLEPVGPGRPGRLRDALLAAGEAAAVRVVVARALEAAVDVVGPHSRGADEVDVDDPGEELQCSGAALTSPEACSQSARGQAKAQAYWRIAEVAVRRGYLG